jgi:hypothetical protein
LRKRRGAKRSPRSFPRQPLPPQRSVQAYLLDQFSARDLRRWAKQHDEALAFHWAFYAALLDQRSRVREAISAALREAATGPLEIEAWHRVIPYEYSFQPLSTVGSVKSVNGGRFNIGGINSEKFPEFPALYLAADRETALAEKLGIPRPEAAELGALDLALRTEGSTTMVLVRGHLEEIIDLRNIDRLEPFVALIEGFTIPPELLRRARHIGLPSPTVVTSTSQLRKVMLDPDWRQWPAVFDVPVTSQIFGQEVRAAGIEGIVYPSSKTDTPCVAIFPDVLGPQSFVELIGPCPPDIETRMDATNWKQFV